MTAYSFHKRFVGPILAGTKLQTIRGPRAHHARPGGQLQLYTAMRTKHCRLIARSTCAGACRIKIDLNGTVFFPDTTDGFQEDSRLDRFAIADGFLNWEELRSFWRKMHPGVEVFDGVQIKWHPLDFSAEPV